MTPQPHPQTPDTDADETLRRHLREALSTAPVHDLDALQARTLAQWRQRTTVQPLHHPGPLAVLQGGWRQHPALYGSTLLALGLAALLLIKPWAQPDPTMEELLQPDVLSLMAAGEL